MTEQQDPRDESAAWPPRIDPETEGAQSARFPNWPSPAEFGISPEQSGGEQSGAAEGRQEGIQGETGTVWLGPATW